MINPKSILLLLLLPLSAYADTDKTLDALPCGIYDESVKPLVEKDLETQKPDSAGYTMGITTKSGKKLSVEVKSVQIKMPGERNQVTVLLDGKPYVKTSHQDVPIYLEVHVDSDKYRIICVRVDEVRVPEENAAGKESKEEGK